MTLTVHGVSVPDSKLARRIRHIANCAKADSAYGAGVAEAIARFGQKISAGGRKVAR